MTAQDHTTFQEWLQLCYEKISHEDVLKKIRAKAWELFTVQGLPTKEAEVFQYLRLRHFFSQTYTDSELVETPSILEHVLPECVESHIVFVNGHYSPSLSNVKALPKIVISTLNDAVSTYGTFLNNQWSKGIKDEADPFALVNTALHRDAAFIYVPPKTQAAAPLQILNVYFSEKPMLTMPRLQLFLGAHSELNLISSNVQISGQGCAINGVADFHLEEGAKLHYVQNNMELSSDAWHFEALRANLKRNSNLKTTSFTRGSNTIRNDYRVVLAGENCEASLNGLSKLQEKHEAHTNVLIEHRAPHCRSNQLFKTILDDFSRSSFEGKIYVHPEAQKTEAFQLNRNLVLSDGAYIASKPNLEIFADDVKASHGATVGQLDAEQLFYMKARGIERDVASSLLIYGFCQDIVDLCPLNSLKVQLEKLWK